MSSIHSYDSIIREYVVWSQMKISDLGYSTIDKILMNTSHDKDVDETFKWKFNSKAKLESLSFP